MDSWPLPRCVWSSLPSPWSPPPPSSTRSTWARSRGSRLSTSRSLKWQSASVTFIWCSLFKILRVASFPCCSSSMVILVYKSICIDRSIIQYRSFISVCLGRSRYDVYYSNYNYSVFAIFFLLAFLIMDHEAIKFVRRKYRNFWENQNVEFERQNIRSVACEGSKPRNKIYVIRIEKMEF